MVGKIYFADETDRVTRAAMALLDCDEDMTDERISELLNLGLTPPARLMPREAWADLPHETRQAYLRIARAALAAAAYPLALT